MLLKNNKFKFILSKQKILVIISLTLSIALLLTLPKFCQNQAPPTTHLTLKRDSIPSLRANGVTTFISDSGYMKYRIIAQEWEIYDKTKPPRQQFKEGICFQRFNLNNVLDLYFTADSAWCFNETLWKFKGHVFIHDIAKESTFESEELFWDRVKHIFYSNKHIKITEPNRLREGSRFEANEQFTMYKLYSGKGYTPVPKDTIVASK